MAMFAERVLLVEGPSDEIIATQLARRLGLRLLARNAQILPITGKGEFSEVARLFRLMNKQVALLADLDALSDDNKLINYFSQLPEAPQIADKLGRRTISDLDNDLRADLAVFITKHKAAVEMAERDYPDWSSKESTSLVTRRVTLARLLTAPESFSDGAALEASSLRIRYKALIGALAELGCFFLLHGAIENYYCPVANDRSKPGTAAEEAASFETRNKEEIIRNYEDIVVALSHIAPNQRIDEDRLLRPKLGAALAAAFLGMKSDSSNEQLNIIANATIGADAEVFKLINCSTDDLRIKVDIASPLFHRDTFPFEIARDDNPNIIVPSKLPGSEDT
jgi:hypothetical protein